MFNIFKVSSFCKQNVTSTSESILYVQCLSRGTRTKRILQSALNLFDIDPLGPRCLIAASIARETSGVMTRADEKRKSHIV